MFQKIPDDAPLIVAIANWQYSHHVLAGLRSHRGPILTVANFAGDWPGLVGLLGLNGSMTKAGIDYSTIWSVDFTDEWFRGGIREWISHRDRSRTTLARAPLPAAPGLGDERELGHALW